MFRFNTRSNRSASIPENLGDKIRFEAGHKLPQSLNDQGSKDLQSGGQQEARDSILASAQAVTGGFTSSAPVPIRGRWTSRALSFQRMPSTVASPHATLRSSSAPALTGYLGSVLGPVCGVATSKTTHQLLAQLLNAQTVASTGHPVELVSTQFDVAQARKALLRRDLKQDASIEELAATPIERVFESILAEELVKNMPSTLLQSIAQVAHWIAHEISQLDDARAERMMKGFVVDLRKEHPRPWSAQQPLLEHLCEGQELWRDKRAALTAFLQGEMTQGIDGLAALVLVRSSFIGYKSAGLDTNLAPWLKDADRNYQVNIIPRKAGRPHAATFMQKTSDQMVGITNLGQSSPLQIGHLIKGVRATYRESINLSSKDAQESIAYGNPVAAGLSGTTNMFLHAVSYHNAISGAPRIDGTALVTLLAALTCYDGGHSIHEVFATGHILHALPQINMPEFIGYMPGHARGMFVDLVTRYGARNLAEVAFDRLEKHFREDSPV